MGNTNTLGRRRPRRQSPSSPPAQADPGAANGLALTLGLTAALLALTLLPRIRGNDALTWSFWGAAGCLLAWQAILTIRARQDASFTPALGLMTPRPQHYVQSLCQFCVYAYWGWYWRPVYDFAPLLLGQLVFAYAVDMLLSWSRREKYSLGFGPFPIVFSTNLFLWFRDDWFTLQ